MCTEKRLKKLIKVLDASKEKAPEMLYQGDFVRYKPDGEIYVVAVLWWPEKREYLWGLVSLQGSESMDTFPDDWVSSIVRTSEVPREMFWEDTDPAWEVINLEETCDEK